MPESSAYCRTYTNVAFKIVRFDSIKRIAMIVGNELDKRLYAFPFIDTAFVKTLEEVALIADVACTFVPSKTVCIITLKKYATKTNR